MSARSPDGSDIHRTLFLSLPIPAWVYDAGTPAFLPKPFSALDLARRVRDLLDARQG